MPPKLMLFDALNKKVVQEKEETLQALKTAMETVPIRVDYEKKRETFAASVRTLQDPNASVKEKNLLLKQCIEKNQLQQKTQKNRITADLEKPRATGVGVSIQGLISPACSGG